MLMQHVFYSPDALPKASDVDAEVLHQPAVKLSKNVVRGMRLLFSLSNYLHMK